MSDTVTEVEDVRAALAEEFLAAAAEARGRLAAVIEPACPTPSFMSALANELQQAKSDPSSVPYPELADSDRYWADSIQPQVRSAQERIERIVEWVESQIVQSMGVAEADMKRLVDERAINRNDDAASDRSALESELLERCSQLHQQMAEVFALAPDRDCLNKSRSALADDIRERAMADVDGLKSAYMAEAGGDEAHQRFADEQWSTTYADRVAHREAMLAGQSPWRHQFLAQAGFERICDHADSLLEASVARLQAPLSGLPALLLERFDEATA